jgi:hypothetical protein
MDRAGAVVLAGAAGLKDAGCRAIPASSSEKHDHLPFSPRSFHALPPI